MPLEKQVFLKKDRSLAMSQTGFSKSRRGDGVWCTRFFMKDQYLWKGVGEDRIGQEDKLNC